MRAFGFVRIHRSATLLTMNKVNFFRCQIGGIARQRHDPCFEFVCQRWPLALRIGSGTVLSCGPLGILRAEGGKSSIRSETFMLGYPKLRTAQIPAEHREVFERIGETGIQLTL